MQPESNEEREAWDVRHVRRLLGFADDYAAHGVDEHIRQLLKRGYPYWRIVRDVKAWIGCN